MKKHYNKRYVSIIFTVLVLIYSSCKKLDKLTQFEIDYTSSVVVPSSVGINLPFNLATPDIQSNSESKFAANDTRKDLIEEVILKKMSLTLTSPSSGDLGFLKAISIYISANGLPEVKIAYKDSVPSNVDKTLNLETTSTDIQQYMKSNTFNLRLNTTTDELITSDHHIDIATTFFVDAKLIK